MPKDEEIKTMVGYAPFLGQVRLAKPPGAQFVATKMMAQAQTPAPKPPPPPEPTGGSSWTPLLIGAVVLAVLGSLAWAGGAFDKKR